MRFFIKPISLIVLLLCVALAHGQHTVSGVVADSITTSPVEFANVIIKPQGGDSIIAGTITDLDGKFELSNIANGNYDLFLSFIGYNQKVMPITVAGKLELGQVAFAPSSTALDVAEVVAHKQLIVKNSEKTVYNVAQDPTNQVGNAEDVLRNMPGVSIDSKGNVSIIGKQGVRVLVDGKPNALAENNLQAFLKSIPANSIESIEIITNPSARYDAEGNAGIINIKLKKGKADGFNTNLSVGYGILDRYNSNVALNYRKKKVNVFGSYAFQKSKTYNRYIEDRIITVDDSLSFYKLDSKGTQRYMNNNVKAGLDWFVNDKATLTYTIGSNFSKGKWYSDATSTNRNGLQEVVADYESINDSKNNNTTISNSINYTQKLDTSGQELVLVLMHTYVDGSDGADMTSAAFDPMGNYVEALSLHRQTRGTSDINNMVGQLDYVYIFKKGKVKGHKIDAGLKNETTLNNNTFDAYQVFSGNAVYDSLLSNSFNYRENIGALYAMYSGSVKDKFSWSAGLRGEHTFIKSNNNSVNRKYFSLFPNVSLGYNFSEKNNTSVSYSRRVQRPQFSQLNNSISYTDQYSTWEGNPLLQPSFTDVLSASHTLMVKEHMFVLEAIGQWQRANFSETSWIDSNRITRGGVVNGANRQMLALNLYYKLQLTKWWDLQMNHNYNYSHFDFAEGINTGSLSGSGYNLWMATSFRFWKNTTFEINGWMNTGGPMSQGRSLPVGVINASIKKTFLKDDKLSVSIAARNMAQSMKWRWEINNTGLQNQGSWHNIDRVVMFTVSYQLSGKIMQRQGQDNDRLGGGGR